MHNEYRLWQIELVKICDGSNPSGLAISACCIFFKYFIMYLYIGLAVLGEA